MSGHDMEELKKNVMESLEFFAFIKVNGRTFPLSCDIVHIAKYCQYSFVYENPRIRIDIHPGEQEISDLVNEQGVISFELLVCFRGKVFEVFRHMFRDRVHSHFHNYKDADGQEMIENLYGRDRQFVFKWRKAGEKLFFHGAGYHFSLFEFDNFRVLHEIPMNVCSGKLKRVVK